MRVVQVTAALEVYHLTRHSIAFLMEVSTCHGVTHRNLIHRTQGSIHGHRFRQIFLCTDRRFRLCYRPVGCSGSASCTSHLTNGISSSCLAGRG